MWRNGDVIEKDALLTAHFFKTTGSFIKIRDLVKEEALEKLINPAYEMH